MIPPPLVKLHSGQREGCRFPCRVSRDACLGKMMINPRQIERRRAWAFVLLLWFGVCNHTTSTPCTADGSQCFVNGKLVLTCERDDPLDHRPVMTRSALCPLDPRRCSTLHQRDALLNGRPCSERRGPYGGCCDGCSLRLQSRSDRSMPRRRSNHQGVLPGGIVRLDVRAYREQCAHNVEAASPCGPHEGVSSLDVLLMGVCPAFQQ